MSQTHYKLPLDSEVDKDIIDWIAGIPRTKKGELVRHAIRYYMEILGEEEGSAIKFPSVSKTGQSTPKKQVDTSNDQPSTAKKDRIRPKLNTDALK